MKVSCCSFHAKMQKDFVFNILLIDTLLCFQGSQSEREVQGILLAPHLFRQAHYDHRGTHP